MSGDCRGRHGINKHHINHRAPARVRHYTELYDSYPSSTVSRLYWQHCSGAFCTFRYRPSPSVSRFVLSALGSRTSRTTRSVCAASAAISNRQAVVCYQQQYPPSVVLLDYLFFIKLLLVAVYTIFSNFIVIFLVFCLCLQTLNFSVVSSTRPPNAAFTYRPTLSAEVTSNREHARRKEIRVHQRIRERTRKRRTTPREPRRRDVPVHVRIRRRRTPR